MIEKNRIIQGIAQPFALSSLVERLFKGVSHQHIEAVLLDWIEKRDRKLCRNRKGFVIRVPRDSALKN
jgi:hypothetical protein